MDLDTAIVCVANDEIGIRAETKEEAEVIIECAQHWLENSSFEVDPDLTDFEVDSDLTDIPEQWPVFGRSGHMLTWYRQLSPFVATHTIVEASDLLITPLDSSAVVDLL